MNIEINENSIWQMNNSVVEKFFQKNRITKWIWKENDYTISIITDNPDLSWQWILFQSKVQKKFFKYLIYKLNSTIWENLPWLAPDDLINMIDIDFSKWEVALWIDIENGNIIKDRVHKLTHTFIFWWTNSWKTITVKWLLYQIMQYKYSEFIILWKDDLFPFKKSKKVRYVNDVISISKSEFLSMINYLWLNVMNRKKILANAWYDGRYEEYQTEIMFKNPDAEKLSHLFLIMDEYEQLRENMGDMLWWTKEFDNIIKTLANYCRAYGILFYLWTQNFLKESIWIMRDVCQNKLVWYTPNIQSQFVSTDVKNIIQWLPKTFLFYSTLNDCFLRLPFEPWSTYDDKIINIWDKNLLSDNNPQYNTAAEMVNSLIFDIDSDIFVYSKNIYDTFWLSKEYDIFKSNQEFIPFTILLYLIFRDFTEKNISGTTKIFKDLTFKKDIDWFLYEANKWFYQQKGNTTLIDAIKNLYKEGALDEDTFLQDLNSLLKWHITWIIWDTDLSKFFGTPTSNIDNRETNNNVSKINTESTTDKDEYYSERSDNIKNVTNIVKQEAPVRIFWNVFEEKEEEKDTLLSLVYTWEIKPVSFNSMYYIDKLAWEVKKSYEATQYENTIKSKAISRMNAKQIRQVITPVILEITFTLWVPVKKDGDLSKIWRNDLDNLLKATIDGINGTIIKDDKQVYWIKTKIKYIEKQSNIFKNNRVEIKVINLNTETLAKYKNIFATEKQHTPLMIFNLMRWTKIEIPSVNNMYFIHEWKKKITSNTINYKTLLSHYITDYKNAWDVSITNQDVMIYLEFNIKNSEDRDLDNMLKATIDSFQSTLLENDNQVREIMCFKSDLTEVNIYNARIKAQIYKYNPLKEFSELEDNNENGEKTILLDNWDIVLSNNLNKNNTWITSNISDVNYNNLLNEDDLYNDSENYNNDSFIYDETNSLNDTKYNDYENNNLSNDINNFNNTADYIYEEIDNKLEIVNENNITDLNNTEYINTTNDVYNNNQEKDILINEWNNKNKEAYLVNNIEYNSDNVFKNAEDNLYNYDEDIDFNKINNDKINIENNSISIKNNNIDEVSQEEFFLFDDDDYEDDFEKKTKIEDDDFNDDFYDLSIENTKKQIL